MPGDATSASSSTASEPAATPRPISHPPPPDSRKLMPHPAPSRDAPPRSRSPDWQRRKEPSQDGRGADDPLSTEKVVILDGRPASRRDPLFIAESGPRWSIYGAERAQTAAIGR